jgi:hypothetical protein
LFSLNNGWILPLNRYVRMLERFLTS